MKNRTLLTVMLTILLAAAAGCSPSSTPQSASPVDTAPAAATAASFGDPFAYCAAVGTIDAPDWRYTGEKTPDAVVNGFKKAAGLEGGSEPSDIFKKATIWRCLDGKVYACNFGANLTCDSKADTNKIPTQAMNDYCKTNPTSDFIPMAVTGHATVYSWQCAQGHAEAGVQLVQVDPQGYIARIWYPIAP